MRSRCTRLLCRGTGSVQMGKDPSRLPERLTDLCFRGRRLAESDPKQTNGLLAMVGDLRPADGHAADRQFAFPVDLISGRGGDANPG